MPHRDARRRRNARNNDDPPTPHPRVQERFLAPRVGERRSPTSLSPATPAIQEPVPLVNRAGPGEPLFVSVARPGTEPTYHVPAQPREKHYVPVQARELHCHYPEKIYLSSVLPTRTPRELQGFQHHCQEQYRTGSGQEFVYEFSLRDLREITTSALNFQNLLYRNQVILTASGIIEYYARIRRNTRVNSTDTAYLEPAYEVSYTWNQSSWVVTQIESARE
ncbi:hypothetical protein BJV77DRAFT_967025 [Russula vinacea]|nr:hypothetical protein BJV77DRAFT_967025 [Russula vinacea]